MDDGIKTADYIRMMQDVLDRKKEGLRLIRDITEKQANLLSVEEFDSSAFDETLKEKEKHINGLNELDDGFNTLYKKIADEIKNNPKQYEDGIKKLQKLITEVTDLSISITGLEKKNKSLLEAKGREIKKGVKNFKVSRQTANSYYKNMIGNGGDGPVFLDKKN